MPNNSHIFLPAKVKERCSNYVMNPLFMKLLVLVNLRQKFHFATQIIPFYCFNTFPILLTMGFPESRDVVYEVKPYVELISKTKTLFNYFHLITSNYSCPWIVQVPLATSRGS